MRVISTYLHGVLDYVFGVALLIAPNLFGFAELSGAVSMVPRVLGVIILLEAVLTDYEAGILRVIPFRVHLTADYILAVFLASSPWIYRFNNLPDNAWMPHAFAGVLLFVVSLLTEHKPRRVPARSLLGGAQNEQDERLRKTAY